MPSNMQRQKFSVVDVDFPSLCGRPKRYEPADPGEGEVVLNLQTLTESYCMRSPRTRRRGAGDEGGGSVAEDSAAADRSTAEPVPTSFSSADVGALKRFVNRKWGSVSHSPSRVEIQVGRLEEVSDSNVQDPEDPDMWSG